ncbi:MAG: hypothetical protein IPP06_18340 [Saprospiraceae bacterium]|nr:hypothetical protein [Candidatus Vicinibacter affinis]
MVITTPKAIKSILLRYLEALYVLEDESRQTPATIRSDVHELSRILQLLRDGCLIMDEVDLILHPLKSELNFPIGATRFGLLVPAGGAKYPIHLLDAIFMLSEDACRWDSKRAHYVRAQFLTNLGKSLTVVMSCDLCNAIHTLCC